MNKTLIPWVKNPDGTQGYTWNPITGCLNGCEYCYARKLANGRLKSRYLANTDIAPPDMNIAYLGDADYMQDSAYCDPFYPRFWEDRFGNIPLKPPRGIFVCDMGELFGDWFPRDWKERVFNIIKGNPQHLFYLLTKQPQNLIKFSPFPDNCWVGVTATDADKYWDAWHALKDIEASVKYISFEPLLSGIAQAEIGIKRANISWVIIGAQTKPYKPPKIEWVEEIVRACDKASVPVFIKNNLKPVMRNSTWRIRQEMPTTNV